MKESEIALVGAGVVGSITAYTLMMRNIASRLILVDVKDSKCRGEVDDLSDALSFSTTAGVRMGTLSDAGQADIAIITAGSPQKPGQSRTQLLQINRAVINDVISGMKPLNPNLILIVVTNPVDVLTYQALQLSGLAKHQVLGSGTLLDTQRLRHLIGERVGVSEQSIHVYVLGEHGDTQCVSWSSGTIAEKSLLEFPELSLQVREDMARIARDKAYNIIACKGATAFGIAACVSAYCQNIIDDTKRTTPVSCYVPEYDVCMSMPVVIGARGIEKIIIPSLSEQEKAQLNLCAQTIRSYIKS